MPKDKLLLGGVLLAIALVSGCGPGGEQSAEEGGQSPSGERVEVGGTEALVWGVGGGYGVVMAHGASFDAASWEEQGRRISADGIVALAPEDTSPENLLASLQYLEEERGAVRGVALMGASAGGGTVLQAAEEKPEAADQLILLSSVSGEVSELGPEPKLFVASEEEEGFAEYARRMAAEAPGDENELLILPGDAHAQAIFQTEEGDRLMQIILERLEKPG